MRTPTRIPDLPPNPYDELASLADPVAPEAEKPEDEPEERGGGAPPDSGRSSRSDRSVHSVVPAGSAGSIGSPGTFEAGESVGSAKSVEPVDSADSSDFAEFLDIRLVPDSPESLDDAALARLTSPPGHRRSKRGRSGRGHRARRASRRVRHRRRFAAVPRALKLLIGVAVLGAFLVLGDRCAVLYAEKKAAEKIRDDLHLAAGPQVDIHGFPFLTQVLGKRLERVDITVPHIDAGRVSLAEVRASGRDIKLTGDLPTAVRGAVIGELDGDVRLSFADLNRELGASQVRFSDAGGDTIAADGRIDVGGQELRVRARAQLRRTDDRGLATDIDGMSVDVPHIATYRPGRDKGLTLHREAAERVSRDAARVKALLSVPSLAARLGVGPDEVAAALSGEDRLRELTGAPRFVERLMRVNLVDAVADHPGVLRKIGVDPDLIGALMRLRPPELTDRLSFSFRLPEQAKDVRLRAVTVDHEGIRAELSGVALPVGRTG
ncbi:LmeA family phospholipid-binding protein [Streptomyces albireticuli]|uniref:LmeA family phospholipid-binding protein n=1 Tax=Streptomyces albireticuli TaxID=1940 RepID=UPI0036933839